jgi:hypothetical protein
LQHPYKTVQHISETSETLEIYAWRLVVVKLTGVELVDGTGLAAMVEKVVAGPVKKAAAALHTHAGGARAVRGVRSAASCA